ncbi:hypothetical protein SAMN05421493_11225 [Pseudobutyrivibrio sp. 49]|uniref:hypothetical protein n=1 Tax=unclassified Pseudobutyrivibrio TaxID=2638619 RepID=UPI000890E254|nr:MULTISPECIES: hypothetical protein [unclassified Pseudobutyrivibrio]SDI34911.1 hypothetical protein SAMN05421493_11225 [Pseudobutyrivibrio sp. 49]SFN93950.1 hypothetical protein SAMN04487831_10588 [Pseudobutyrivibrio sp. UC1225]
MWNKLFKKKNLRSLLGGTLIASIIIFSAVGAIKSYLDSSYLLSIKEDAVPLAMQGIYKYCPTSINGQVLYCSNQATPGEVKDGICFNETKVMSTTAGSWDSVQVCDPSVVEGNFIYMGKPYKYLMAYLGCATYDCTANEIGFAVSNNLASWRKTGRVVEAIRDGHWGVGQPSLINYNGIIYLFYTSGTVSQTTTFVEQLDCTDLGNVQHLGKKQITCSYDFISNADFAFTDDALYMTCDTHPFPGGALNFISGTQSVYMAPWNGTFESLDSLAWDRIALIGAETTGHGRNHNGCFSRDGSGRLAARVLYVSTADEIGTWSQNLFTYRFTAVAF